MRVVAVGCEYSGVSTLIDRIYAWGRERGINHHLDDHFTIPDASHLDEEEQRAMLDMLPAIKERFQRFQIVYHVRLLHRYEHILMGGFHIEEAVYGPRYYYPGKNVHVREYEPDMPGDVILVHLHARPRGDPPPQRKRPPPSPDGAGQRRRGGARAVPQRGRPVVDSTQIRHRHLRPDPRRAAGAVPRALDSPPEPHRRPHPSPDPGELKMKIVDIGAVLLQPTPWVLVKVRTDEGITGIGEAYHGAGVHHIAVDERLTGRALIGQDPRNVDRLFRDMKSSMSASGYYQGAVMSAISGIEMALWDITGQALGVPIWQLLGGAWRDSIRIYNDCHAGEDEEDPASWAAKAKAVEARGFDAIKFDIDPRPDRRDLYNRTMSNRDIAFHIEVVTAIREALHPDTDLLIDAHWAYAPHDILKVAYAFEELDLMWLEDPIPAENVAAPQGGQGGDARPDLHRREPVHPARVPRAGRDPGDGHHLARPRQGGRPVRGSAHRRPGRHLLHADLTAQHLRADRHDGDGPRLRRFPQLPGSRVPPPRQRGLEQPHGGARPDRRRTHPPAARSRSRRHPRRGDGAPRRARGPGVLR